MEPLTVGHADAAAVFSAQLEQFVSVVGGLDDHALLAASRCHGWSRLDVVVHMRTGLQEMLGGVVSPTDRAADTDAASYWVTYAQASADADPVADILWTRRTASAYARPTGAVEHLTMAADGLRTAVAAMPRGCVAFQGCVLTSGDLLATWAVELAVHHLDLGDGLAPPDARALQLARTTIERLVGARLPTQWSDEDAVLLGASRRQPSTVELEECGHVLREGVLG